MKLYSSPASPFARKCRIVAFELEIKLDILNINPRSSEDFRRINPLAKIPVLVLDDGSTLFDSPVICEYLNDMKSGHFVPSQSLWRNDSGRWRALGLQALGDGLSDAAVVCAGQRRLAPEQRQEEMIAREMAAIAASLDMLEGAVPKFAKHPAIGEVAVGCALGYLDFRLPDLAWQATRPALRGWHDRFEKYPAAIATAPAELT